MYNILFEKGWDQYYKNYDSALQERIMKKIEKQQEEHKTRHLKHGLEFYVVEVGQYRCAIKINESTKTKVVYFIGNHKQYEWWYKSAKQ